MKFGWWLVWVDYLTTLVVGNKVNPDKALEMAASVKKIMTGAAPMGARESLSLRLFFSY
jgi:hypothetical protein